MPELPLAFAFVTEGLSFAFRCEGLSLSFAFRCGGLSFSFAFEVLVHGEAVHPENVVALDLVVGVLFDIQVLIELVPAGDQVVHPVLVDVEVVVEIILELARVADVLLTHGEGVDAEVYLLKLSFLTLFFNASSFKVLPNLLSKIC